MSLFIYINMSPRNQIEVLSERHSDACLKVIMLFVLIDVAKVRRNLHTRNTLYGAFRIPCLWYSSKTAYINKVKPPHSDAGGGGLG